LYKNAKHLYFLLKVYLKITVT